MNLVVTALVLLFTLFVIGSVLACFYIAGKLFWKFVKW